jgi:hypothetical protein
MNTRFSFERLVSLLRLSENDARVRNFFGHEMSNIERDEFYGWLEFKPEGVGVVFNEAPWVVPPEKITDPKELWLSAFHLHREFHDGFVGYSGKLPNGVALGDSETELLRKMGEPIKKGGGYTDPADKLPILRWFSFIWGDVILHFQLDPMGRINMATLQAPEIKLT